MRLLVDQALLLFAFIQLGLEYQSVYLFSWPLNHSCAKPSNSDGQQTQPFANKQQQQPNNLQSSATSKDYTFNDSRRNLVNSDAIQSYLFDAYPDDPFTLARASSMGIKYDDIAGCLQYKRQFDNTTNTSSVDLSHLETCPHGLHFEEPTQTISVVSFFNLACSRQYLTIQLPSSFALGLLAGITITVYCLIKKVDHLSGNNQAADQSSRQQQQQQTASGAISQAATPTAANRSSPVNLYYWFLTQIAANVMLQTVTYLVGRFNFTEDDEESQHPELYGQFVVCILLRSYVAASNLTRIIYMHKTTVKRNMGIVSYELFRDNHRRFQLFGAIFILFEALYAPLALRLVSKWWRLNELLTVYSFCFTSAVFIRELIASGSNGETGLGANGERGATNQLVFETNIDENVEEDNDSFMERTVYSRCEFCSIQESPLSIADNPYAPTTTQPVIIDGVLSSHNSSLTQQALHSRYLMVQLVLLTFCLSYNYFLFLMLPDHKLLHSETTASRFRRKLSYAEEMAKEKEPVQSYNYTIEHGANSNETIAIFHDNETFVDHPSQLKQFDYRSINRATQSIESMKNSINPIEILWTTAKLNEWPIDLFVFVLHLSRISRFESVYFKLGRLFTAIQLCAKFLAFEWLLIGFVKRPNHLLEWDWLYTICVLLARLSSGLMLSNYFNSMLKLNTRLRTNRLMLFLPNTLVGLLAFSLASYAPLFEWIDLVIIPISAISVNLLILWLTKNLGEQFKVSLCPMIFEDPEQSNRQQQQRMVLVEPVEASEHL